MSDNKKAVSVSQLNNYILRLLNNQSVLHDIWVRGELSNVKVYSSGHYYFNLKDDYAQIPCVLFKSNKKNVNFEPKDGDAVLVRAKTSIYEKDGKLQLYVNEMQVDGKGNLFLLFENLKKKLAQEGLFSSDHKIAIPKMPKVIGVATSRSGAVIQDIINVSKRRFPLAKILLAPCSVQGDNAAVTIVNAIQSLDNIDEVDVIIVGRGGGSIEDLWPFNEEIVARAVYYCKKPIISAVGHESDTTICDYVADLRAPTPSAAAELALPSQSDIYTNLNKKSQQFRQFLRGSIDISKSKIDDSERNLQHRIFSILNFNKQRLDYIANNKYLTNPYENLNYLQEIVANNQDKMELIMNNIITRANQSLSKQISNLEALSPLKILSRGYAMVYSEDTNTPLISSKGLKLNDKLDLLMKDAKLKVEIEEIVDNEGDDLNG